MTIKLHRMSGGSFTNWIKLLWENGGIDRKYLLRALSVSIFRFLSIPMIIYENIRFGKKIENFSIKESPIFIIGHHRSGTTYLHNLMIQDENFGYISLLQCLAPNHFLVSEKLLKLLTKITLPKTRPMDNVSLSIDSPEEEEFAMSNISVYSGFHLKHFPKKMLDIFTKYVLFNGTSQQIKECWKNQYIKVLKKASFSMNSKKLILKTPENMARIKLLLEMFPDAKFIHIYRNPYNVYLSTKNLYLKDLAIHTFQNINIKDIEKNIFFFYKELMQRFFVEKTLIPSQNFIEIKFEDFEANPLKELEKVYYELKLPGFQIAEEYFRKYIETQKEYKKNEYLLDDKTQKKIYQNWKFTIEKWKYDVPDNLELQVRNNIQE